MNTKAILTALSLLVAAGSSFAADTNEAAVDQAFRSTTASTLTRAQVRAEVIAARKAGTLEINDAYQDIAYMAPRAKSAEVKAQVAAKPAEGNSTH